MTYADIGDLEIVDDERVPLRAGAEVHCRQVLGEAQLCRPLRVGVGKRKDLLDKVPRCQHAHTVTSYIAGVEPLR